MQTILDNWNAILEKVKEVNDMETVSFDTWLKPLKPLYIDDGKLYISTGQDNAMAVGYINKTYKIFINEAIGVITGKTYDLEFLLPNQVNHSLEQKQSGNDDSYRKNLIESAHLNPKYTFDRFVVGNNSKFAHSASLAVAESPGDSFNPLYIYGGPGLGKTHLIQSIGHFILNHKSDTKVLYVTSEEFTNEVIDSIRSGNSSSMSRFRDKYRTVDVLMIDDIQFIIGKESTQEEFFHTFNVLHGAGKQIIISSDVPPKEMEALEERIRQRFEWGLIADIGSPDYETRMAILKKKEEDSDFNLGDEILDYIATNIKSNIRELEGALNKLIAYKKLVNVDITLDIAKDQLQTIISPDKPKEITAQLIIETVAEHCQISVDNLINGGRDKQLTTARHTAMYLCKKYTNTSSQAIGKLLCKDHTTVLHAIKKITKSYEEDPEITTLVDDIVKKLNPN